MKPIYINILVVVVVVGAIVGVFMWGNSYTNALNEKKQKASNFTLQLPDFNKYTSNDTVKTNALGDGAIVSRAIKGLGGYKHYGVMYKDKVLHFNQYGCFQSTLKEFSENIPIKVVKRGLHGPQLENFHRRVESIIQRYTDSKYDAMNNNCEHYVNELVYNVKISIQSDVTKEMLIAYDTVIQNELIKNNMQIVLPVYNSFMKKVVEPKVVTQEVK